MWAIDNSEKPVAAHCLHGSDRTGAVIAAYRIVYQGRTKEAAIAEFQQEQFGYHEGWFPNILDLLQTMDFDGMKKDIIMVK